MKIQGADGLSAEQVQHEVARGAKFVMYQYCISALVMTFRRNTDIYFLRPGESAAGKGMQWTLISLILGWWGIPWGLIWTPMIVYKNLTGGKDVTAQMMSYLTPVSVTQPGVWPPPPSAFPQG